MSTGRSSAAALAMMGGLALVATGCGGGSGGSSNNAKADASKISISPANAAKVDPNARVAVHMREGKLDSVTVRSASGTIAPGAMGVGNRSWRAKWTLQPGTRYTVTARAKTSDGKQTEKSAKFTTRDPGSPLKSTMSPLDGEKVGVGMPVQVMLTRPVTDRAAVERALEIRMSKPVEGGWHWIGDKEVDFRPRVYWPSGEKVHVDAHLAGVEAGKGLWGAKDQSIDFTIGPKHISTVDSSTHHMKVTSDGKTVRSIPVSLGKPGDDTYTGTMIAQEKAAHIIMDSATTGHPGEYRIPTKWNVRLTYSGEFVHAAPWSVGSQGSTNVSHGCVNVSPSNAKWFFDFTNRGDIIKVLHTSRKLRWGNGPTPWVLSWSEWLKGSALHKPVNAGAG